MSFSGANARRASSESSVVLALGYETKRFIKCIEPSRQQSTRSLRLYGWMDWIIGANPPFPFCENDLTRRYSKLDKICDDTPVRGVDAVILELEATLGSYMPAIFCIIFDGWSHKPEHSVGVFAVFEHDNKAETVLLAMAQ